MNDFALALAWLLAVAGAGAAGWLYWRGRQARAAQAQAEARLASVERARRELSLVSDWYVSQFQALLEAQLEAVLVIGADRAVLDMNAAARELFGAPPEASQTVILVTRSVELDELVAACLAGEPDCDRRLALGRAHLPYRARAVPAGGPQHGGYQGVVVWLQDQSELQRLGRARRDFVANISHELRTPITAIRLLVDTLRGGAARDAAARDDLLEKIAVETEALAQMSQELLDLAQIESGQALLRLVPTPAAEIIATVRQRFAPQAKRKRQHLHVEAPPGLVTLADPAQVARALGNLVHNAIKFTPPEGAITVRAAAENGDVRIEVADTGPGLAPEDVPRVFERFFRADRARAAGGTGLGLAIAKHVVEAHGGRIWVASGGGLGHGAVFSFTLPGAELPATSANVASFLTPA
jgi:two-component system phosphate regulon sensor histidine kinase PhoR